MSFERGTALTERRAKGLVAISRYFLEHADTGQHRLGRPHVIVDIPHHTLACGEGSATIGAGKVLDAATARQLACDAGISRLITGPNSEPFDVGRTARSIPAGLAKLLLVEDQGCRWPGCYAPRGRVRAITSSSGKAPSVVRPPSATWCCSAGITTT